jgi:hypothetical protein
MADEPSGVAEDAIPLLDEPLSEEELGALLRPERPGAPLPAGAAPTSSDIRPLVAYITRTLLEDMEDHLQRAVEQELTRVHSQILEEFKKRLEQRLRTSLAARLEELLKELP